MNPQQWLRAKDLFGDLLEADAAQRAQRLAEEHDAVVQAEVQRLLAADARAAEFLQHAPSGLQAGTDALLGHQLGPFLIERVLGEGGNGRVYLARRRDLGGEVAIKLLRGRLLNPDLDRRFRAEQSILARLDHPNIARLLQVGVAEDGTPWLAMEYVDGEDFDTAMAALPLAARLRVILKLLDALDYAHRQLVVHRDIKPGNVLVDRRGEPRLLDFGIAKRLDEVAELTGTQERPRTPAYATPEQIRGEPVSVATDVYAMGVLLYQALTGSKVWSESGRQLDEAILASEPGLPSKRVSGALRRNLEGDLDAIVLQAMQRDPPRRYPSAAAMAADLRAHLAQRPVSARRQTWVYRSQRYLLRNRGWVSVALLAVVVLLALASRELRHQQLTLLEAQKSDEVARFMLEMFDAGDSLAVDYPISRHSTVIDLMTRGEARLDDLQLAPLVRADLAHKMGQVYWGLSEYGAAERLLQAAVDLRERELGAHDDTAESLLMLGRVHERTSRYPSMLALMQRSYQMRLATLGPGHPHTIHSLHRVGTAHYFLNDLDQAGRDLQAAIDAWRALRPGQPADLANALTMQAFVLSDRGLFEQALPLYEEALTLSRAVFPAGHPHLSEVLHNLSTCLYDLGRVDTAIEMHTEAIAIDEAAFDGDNRALVIDYEWMSRYRLAAGQLSLAAELADKAVAMATRLDERNPDPGTLQRARQMQAEVWRAEGRLDEALTLQQVVLQSRLQFLPPTHIYLINSRSVLADLLLKTSRIDEAQAQLTQALSAWRAQPAGYSEQLLHTLRQFSQAGECRWLDGEWPADQPPAMAAAMVAARGRCEQGGGG